MRSRLHMFWLLNNCMYCTGCNCIPVIGWSRPISMVPVFVWLLLLFTKLLVPAIVPCAVLCAFFFTGLDLDIIPNWTKSQTLLKIAMFFHSTFYTSLFFRRRYSVFMLSCRAWPPGSDTWTDARSICEKIALTPCVGSRNCTVPNRVLDTIRLWPEQAGPFRCLWAERSVDSPIRQNPFSKPNHSGIDTENQISLPRVAASTHWRPWTRTRVHWVLWPFTRP